jgi:VanZ family protein
LLVQRAHWFDLRVSRTHRFLRYWLPVIVWMALIFSASGDKKSSQTSSRLIAPIVKFFVPDISPKRLDQIVFTARKAAHVTEYAVLSWLLARAFLRPGTPWGRWERKAAALAWLIASLYAASDELHQAFVPNRQGRWGDVWLDSFGAAVGIAALYQFGRWRKYW